MNALLTPLASVLDTLCTPDEGIVDVGKVLDMPVTAPFTAVHAGTLWGVDVLIYVLPLDTLPATMRFPVRMGSLFFGETTEASKMLALRCMMHKEHAFYVVTERTANGVLRSLLESQTLLDVRSSLQILLDVAIGMRYLHDRDIIHRSLTASSVHLTKFGAKIGSHTFCREIDTRPMTNIGIPFYAAPEILVGNHVYTEKVDVYSFAMRTYTATSLDPYANVDAPEAKILKFIVQHHYRPVFVRTSEWPAALFTLMEKCWHPDPQERPSFPVIVERLEAMLVEQA
ncbi:TKL protein kinase [Saprolegnia diclina VS20]|uniref:TKL protein kinase n=1 Tax=Saprolegnia diclina (strain VS20) TaxID=1156394 RepID=T0PZQ6_SAPDV|nr:TKL protein kinase [Saprolegnia diclina VS20]EQC26580.1 TKL protein kinase [Saprolegnia diclina VS20]|eukprot:XP_008620010.1 TKL protein kinase [Saprolegnia diclina VS20]